MDAPSSAAGSGPGAAAAVIDIASRLWCRRGSPPHMESAHRHNDIEINLVLSGALFYVHGGRSLVVREGQVAVFWAAQPHGLVDSRPGDVVWVHVPLSTVMSWRLPEAELGALTRLEPIVVDAAALAPRLEAMIPMWLDELRDDGGADVALLEVQAALRRILKAACDQPAADAPERPAGSPDGIHRALEMAQFIVERFRDDIAVADVAEHVHLTPSHAMTLFRRTVGVTIGDHLAMCRVAEAQRLLVTTSRTSSDIAAASGFGSLSSFYAHVTAACGMSPGAYRRSMRML